MLAVVVPTVQNTFSLIGSAVQLIPGELGDIMAKASAQKIKQNSDQDSTSAASTAPS